MKAIAVTRYLPIEDPQSLTDVEIDKPAAAGRDLLVAVKAIGVNPIDTKVRARQGPDGTLKVLGYDAAGVVEAVGPDAQLFRPGDEVFYAGDIRRPGTNSAFHLADERVVGRKPRSLGFAEAAALPLTSITAYEVLFDRIGLDAFGGNAGETLLIIGGAGGVGSMAIQLGKLAGLTVIATASRPETSAWVRKLGADHAVDHRQALRPQIEALGFGNVHSVAVFADTDQYWDGAVDLVRPQGTIGLIVDNVRPLAQGVAKAKSVKVAWEMMFTRPMFQTPDMIEQHRLLNRVADLIDEGAIQTTVQTAMAPIDAENLRRAHKMLEAGRTIGKIVLEGW